MLLGIDPSRIRVMNVIREDSRRRRRRQAESHYISIPGRFRRDSAQTTLQIEISPAVNDDKGREGLNEIGSSIVENTKSVVDTVSKSLEEQSGKPVKVEESLSIAIPPVPPQTPPPPVSLAEMFNIDDENMDEDELLEALKNAAEHTSQRLNRTSGASYDQGQEQEQEEEHEQRQKHKQEHK